MCRCSLSSEHDVDMATFSLRIGEEEPMGSGLGSGSLHCDGTTGVVSNDTSGGEMGICCCLIMLLLPLFSPSLTAGIILLGGSSDEAWLYNVVVSSINAVSNNGILLLLVVVVVVVVCSTGRCGGEGVGNA